MSGYNEHFITNDDVVPSCTGCGVLVGDPDQHDVWHRLQDALMASAHSASPGLFLHWHTTNGREYQHNHAEGGEWHRHEEDVDERYLRQTDPRTLRDARVEPADTDKLAWLAKHSADLERMSTAMKALDDEDRSVYWALEYGGAEGENVWKRLAVVALRALQAAPPQLVTDPCECGHERGQHIYDEGSCRPGEVCPCERFQVSADKASHAE